MEVQQSDLYAEFIKSIHWNVVDVDGIKIFTKHIPLMGGLAKIQRSQTLPDVHKLITVFKSEKIKTVAIEPDTKVSQLAFNEWIKQLARHYRIYRSSFLPTKTALIDLGQREVDIFQKFSEAKRRAVRRAQKNNVIVKQSTSIENLIKIKNKSAGLFGFITTHGIRNLWSIFSPVHASILLAYQSDLIGGILLIFWDSRAYYWIAGATPKGKKLFAPTLLIWEALKLSKKMKCKRFDFVGVWDERMPKQFHEWKGFTKFKEGFGGYEQYYPITELSFGRK